MNEEELKKLQQAYATGRISKEQLNMGIARVNNLNQTADSILADFIPYNTSIGLIQPQRNVEDLTRYSPDTNDLFGSYNYNPDNTPRTGSLPNQGQNQSVNNFNYTPTSREIRRSERFTGTQPIVDENGYNQADRAMLESFKNPDGTYNIDFLNQTQADINKDIETFSEQELKDFQEGNINNVTQEQTTPPQNTSNNNALSQAAYLGNLFGAGVSLDTALFSLGQSFAFDRNVVDENGQPVYNDPQRAANLNLLRGVGSAGKLLTGGARQFVSGLGFQNRYNQVSQDYLNQRRQTLIGDSTEVSKNDYGTETFKDGGKVKKKELPMYRGGGSKNDFISAKIKTLMDEGYKQDQAIAIAYSMYDKMYKKKYEDGGELSVEKRLTEEYVTELPKGMEEQANAELEDGEYVKYPNESIQEVKGEKHENGGVELNLPEETQIVSDNLELGKTNAKKISKEFDLSLSAKDTYADAMDKYDKKIGLEKLNKKQEELFSELDKVNKVEDEITRSTNLDYLNGKIRKIEEEKEALETTRKEFFDTLFGSQEESKGNKEEVKTKYKDGGEKIPMYADGGDIQRYLVEKGRAISPGYQALTSGNIAGGVENELGNRVAFYQQALPTLYNKYFANNDYSKDNIKAFQEEYNIYADAVKRYAERTLPEDESKALGEVIDSEIKFVNDAKSAKNIDSLLGKFTSSRPGFTFDVVTPEQQKKLNEIGVTHLSQIPSNIEKIKEAGILPEDKLTQLTGYLNDPELTGLDFRLGVVQPGEVEDTPEKVAEKVVEEVKDPASGITSSASTVRQRVQGPRGYFFPDQSVLPPSSLQPSTLTENRRQRIDPVRVGIEDNLTELFKQQNFVASQLEDIPDSQRAASYASLLASTQEQANKAITATSRINAQNQQQAELFNIAQAGAEDQMRGANLRNYEILTQTAQAKTEKDLRDYFNFNRRVALNNYQNQQNLNLLQTMTPDYTIDPFGNTIQYDPFYDWQVRQSGTNQ